MLSASLIEMSAMPPATLFAAQLPVSAALHHVRCRQIHWVTQEMMAFQAYFGNVD